MILWDFESIQILTENVKKQKTFTSSSACTQRLKILHVLNWESVEIQRLFDEGCLYGWRSGGSKVKSLTNTFPHHTIAGPYVKLTKVMVMKD